MYSKSSTFLALTSILAILAVLSIAINNVQNPVVRRPFPTSGASLGTSEFIEPSSVEFGGIKTRLGNEKVIWNKFSENIIKEKTGLDFGQSKDLSISLNSKLSSLKLITGTESTNGLPKLEIEKPRNIGIDSEINRNINSELLNEVGFKNFVIKPKPFSGMLFEKFDIKMISSLDIVEKQIFELVGGNESLILEAYEFRLGDTETTSEIYNLLKAKVKQDLGVSINQSNQFGVGSFYVNFDQENDNAFVVVKTRLNVYALSYPKVAYTVNGQLRNYADLTTKLLKELN